MAVANSRDPYLPKATAQTTSHQPQAWQSWADMTEEESPDMPLLYEELLRVEPSLEEADSNADSDLLKLDEMEDVEDDFTFPVQQSRPSSASEAARPPVDSSLCEVCKHLKSKLGM